MGTKTSINMRRIEPGRVPQLERPRGGGVRGGGLQGPQINIGNPVPRGGRADIYQGSIFGGRPTARTSSPLPVGQGIAFPGSLVKSLPKFPTLGKPKPKPTVTLPPKIITTQSGTQIRVNVPKPQPLPIFTPPPPTVTKSRVISPPKPIIASGGEPMGLDLGALLSTGIQAYGNVQAAKYQQPVFFDQFNPFSSDPDVSVGPTVVGGGYSGSIPKGYKINCDGKLVKCRRRRRRRLATASDIKDLAALSAVTTGGEKKTWIATHPS